MKKIIKFAIIGCGRVADYYARAIASNEDAKIAAVCDLKEDLGTKLANKYFCKYYNDLNEMLEKEDIDIVSICTSNSSHPSLTYAIAKAKTNILVEKPMALTSTEARDMIEFCKKQGVKLFVVKQNRYNLPIIKLKEALVSGRFGKLVLCNITVRWYRPQEYYNQSEWHGTKKGDGGMLFTQASHYIDMMRWLMGPIESLSAKVDTLAHDIETEDTAVATFKFKNDALGVMEATSCTFPKDLEGSITIIGEYGTAKVGGIAMDKIDVWEFKDVQPEDDDLRKIETNPPDVYGFGHFGLVNNIVKNLQGENKQCIDGEEGIRSVNIIEAIYKSSENNQVVYFN